MAGYFILEFHNTNQAILKTSNKHSSVLHLAVAELYFVAANKGTLSCSGIAIITEMCMSINCNIRLRV